MKTLIEKSIQGFDILYEKYQDKPDKEIEFEGWFKSKEGMNEFKKFYSIFEAHIKYLNKKEE